jgi:hypothetical protein
MFHLMQNLLLYALNFQTTISVTTKDVFLTALDESLAEFNGFGQHKIPS